MELLTKKPSTITVEDSLSLFVELSRHDGYWVVSKLFVRYFRDLNKAVLLSELISKYYYFSTNNILVDGEWFFLTYDKINEVTFLSINLIRKYIKEFVNKQLITVEMKGSPAKQYYRLNHKLIFDLLKESSMISKTSKSSTSRGIKNATSRPVKRLTSRPTKNATSRGIKNARSYNNKEVNNKEVNKKEYNKEYSINGILGSDEPSNLSTKSSLYSKPEDYPERVQDLFQYWQSLSIVKHDRPSKTRNEALERLNMFSQKYTVNIIKKSMDTYKQLLEDEFSILTNDSPYRVGLNEFFVFSNHTKNRIKQHFENFKVKSWFEECLKEDLSHLMKISKDPYPDITDALKKEYELKIGSLSNTTINENSFRKASRLLMEFHSTNKDQLTLQFQRKPVIFSRRLIEYVESIKARNGKHPGWLGLDFVWESFPSWLKEKGYIKEDKNILTY